MGTKVIIIPLHRLRRDQKRAFAAAPPPGPVHRPSRVAVTLALAHKIRAAIADGKLRNQAEVARRLRISNAAISHLLDLLHLAPYLQERVLWLDAIDGREPLTARALRPVLRIKSWAEQRAIFEVLFAPADRQSLAESAEGVVTDGTLPEIKVPP